MPRAKNRVSRQIFNEVFKKTRPFSISGLKLRFYPNKITQVAFVVSKNVAKKATDRNLWKRRGLAVFRKIKNNTKSGTYLFFVQPDIGKQSFKSIEEKILLLLKKSRLIHE